MPQSPMHSSEIKLVSTEMSACVYKCATRELRQNRRRGGPVCSLNPADQQQTIVARLKAMLAEWNKLLVTPQLPCKTQAYEKYDSVLLCLYD